MRKDLKITTNPGRIISDALVVTAKAPIMGKVKTRLFSSMGVKEATEFYECMLKDTLEMVARIKGINRYIAYYPLEARDYFNSFTLSNGFILFSQKGEDLGEKLQNIFSFLFSKGYLRIVVIGSDSPTLPLDYTKDAFKSLRQYPIVLGPCRDGGYYLVGMRGQFYEVFKDIPWSTSRVLEVTLKKANEEGYKVYLLPEWYDIDTTEDINKLLKEIELNNHTWLKHTRGFLKCYLSSP